MPKKNEEIASRLNEMADLLEFNGEDRYKMRAYRAAALELEERADNVTNVMESDHAMEDIPKNGEGIADKIREFHDTGKIEALESLRVKVPDDLREMMALKEVGPQRAKTLEKEKGIRSVCELKKAAGNGELEELHGFGRKTVESILDSIRQYQKK